MPNESEPNPRTSPPPGAYTARPSSKASGASGAAYTNRPVAVAAVLLGLGAATAAVLQSGLGKVPTRPPVPHTEAPRTAAESPAYTERPAAVVNPAPTPPAREHAVADSTALIRAEESVTPRQGSLGGAASPVASAAQAPIKQMVRLKPSGGFWRSGFETPDDGRQPVVVRSAADLPPQLATITTRLLTSHPEVLPVLLKLVAYSKVDDQTGGFREAVSHCGALYQCEHIGKKIVFIVAGELRVEYMYMPALAFGLRNHFDVSNAVGERAQFSDSPLVLDLSGRGAATTVEQTFFDLHGDGRRARLQGLSPGQGVLAFGSGTDGRFLFGNRTDLDGDGKADGYADGFEALRAMARKARREGVISRRALARGRLGPRELRALSRAYGLCVRMGALDGPALTPKQAGVTALVLPSGASRLTRDFDGRGDDISRRDGAVFERSDGSRGEYADVWFRSQTSERPTSASQHSPLALLYASPSQLSSPSTRSPIP